VKTVKRVWKLLMNPHVLFWLMFVCFFINLAVIYVDVQLGKWDNAYKQFLVAGFCAAAAFIQYLRAHGPPEE